MKTRAKHARGIYFYHGGDLTWYRREEVGHLGVGQNVRFEADDGNGFALTPRHYVGAADGEDDREAFEEKMKRLTGLLKQQREEGARLDQQNSENLRRLGYEF